jgi:hypothetical protein
MPPVKGPQRGRDRLTAAGAEGATAPETLRQKDRVRGELWKAGVTSASPKM